MRENKSFFLLSANQKKESNHNFCKFVTQNYISYLQPTGDNGPVMSHNLMRRKVVPLLSDNRPTFFILIDNLRLDQWRTLAPIIKEVS